MRYDAIVIGSGHNALVTSAYLARAGWSVLVLEGNDRPGGLVRTDELTLPGFKHDTYASAHPLFTGGPAYAELGPELAELGLAPPGRAVARLQVLDVPTRVRGDADDVIDVDGGWTSDVKQAFADRVIKLAGRHVTNLEDAILARHIVGPDDLARFNPNCGPGDPFGGSHDLAQSYLFRPLPSQPSHRTTLPNLFMVGAATWPGHGVNGASGHIVGKLLLG